jgi:hypothetical protein
MRCLLFYNALPMLDLTTPRERLPALSGKLPKFRSAPAGGSRTTGEAYDLSFHLLRRHTPKQIFHDRRSNISLLGLKQTSVFRRVR